MIAGLERFVGQLRQAGVPASPGEWLDALRAIDLVGLEDRRQFRDALRAALVKRADQRATFDRLFDTFFAPPGRGPGHRPGPGRGGHGERSRPDPGEKDRMTSGRPGPTPVASERPNRNDDPPRTGHEACRRLLASVRRGGPSREGRLRHVLTGGPPAQSQRVGRGDVIGSPPVARRELRGRATTEDERNLAREVPRMIERIRLRTARRMRRTRSGRIDLRRVFRENAGHGGVPFVLPRRRPKLRKSRVVLLVDVSWSTARSAALFLWMAGEFLRPGRGARVLLFVDRPVEATGAIERWLGRGATAAGLDDVEGAAGRRGGRSRPGPGGGVAPGGQPFDRMLAALPGLNLDAPSDYGRVFHGLLRSRYRPAGRDTVLLILGDGRTNRYDPQAWALDEIASRCGATLWLAPEPVSRWGTADSALAVYLPLVDRVVETADLEGLARGVAELLRRVGGG